MTARELRDAHTSVQVHESMVVPRGAPQPQPNPFPGLRPYGPNEAHLFFGREIHVEALLDKLCHQRLTAVIGSSGSGKSSLVLAGILPRLRRGYRTQFANQSGVRSAWCIARMRPGDDPTRNLAIALRGALAAGADEEQEEAADAGDALELALLDAQLRRNQLGLSEAAAGLLQGRDENLLLIVDQFEELFRFRALSRGRSAIHDPAAAFVQLLLRATQQAQVPIYVMLTMRSDFLGECIQFTGLPEAINEGQYLLPLLNRDQREQVIRGPMAVAQAAIEPALVQRLLNDAGDMTDQLPVLQHALMRSFDLWRARAQPEAPPRLGLDHYELCGGMQGALSTHADEALAEVEAELGVAGTRVVELLLRALTERGIQSGGVRRPCRVSEVLAVTGSDLPTLRKVVARFSAEGRGFLVVQPAAGQLESDSLLDISHEALMRLWKRLATWTHAELAFAQQLQQLDEAAEKHAHGTLGLYREPELTLALSWMEREHPTPAMAARYGVDLARIDRFLRASVDARATALAIERDARTLRRFRSMFTEAKTSTLLALLAIFAIVLVQGSGLLDGVLLGSTRFKLLSVSARHLVAPAGLHPSLAAVVIDDQTVAALRDQSRHGQVLGAFGANWRTLQAELLTKLADAGVRSVVFDIDFQAGTARTALAELGSTQLGAAIRYARSRGTAVAIAGAADTHPAVRDALAEPAAGSSGYAEGTQASACLGATTDGAAVFANLLTMHDGKPSIPGLALAGLAGLWHTPHVFADAANQQLFLGGPGGQRRLAIAGVGRALEAGADCYPSRVGDQPAQQILELSARELTRAHNPPRMQRNAPSLIAFEQILGTSNLAPLQLEGRLVLVGKQHADDRLALLSGERWGMSLHLTAMNDLLLGRAIRPIAPLSQLAWMLALCALVAWQRLQNRDKAPWLRRAVLVSVIACNLCIVMATAIAFDLLMDESYQVLAMLVTYAIVGRLDKQRPSAAAAWHGSRA